MKFRHLGALLGVAASLVLLAPPAMADNYDARDGNGAHQSFAAKLFGGLLHPLHVLEGMFGGTPTPVNMTNSGALDVTCTSGCNTDGHIVDGSTGANVSFADVHFTDLALSSALNQAVTQPLDGGLATVRGYLSGIAGGAQVTIQGSVDPDSTGTVHWTGVTAFQGDTPIPGAVLSQDGSFRFSTAGYRQFRAIVTNAGTGSMKLSYTISSAPSVQTVIVASPPSAKTGSASSTDTSAHTLFAAAGTGIKNYAKALQCTNSSGTDSDVTLNDSTSWSVTIKAGAGFGFTFAMPLSTAANTALTFTMGTGVSTVKCNAQGFTGL